MKSENESKVNILQEIHEKCKQFMNEYNFKNKIKIKHKKNGFFFSLKKTYIFIFFFTFF